MAGTEMPAFLQGNNVKELAKVKADAVAKLVKRGGIANIDNQLDVTISILNNRSYVKSQTMYSSVSQCF